MKHYSKNSTVVNGFTLIEVMLVIVLVGLMVSVVQFSASGDKAEETLELSSKRFAGVFNIAAEYGMLNNIELGLVIGKKGYQFLGYDGITWSDISDNELFSRYKLPEGVELILQLDDLPIEEPQLFDTEVFNELQAANKENDLDEDVGKDDDGNNIEKKILIPQIYILSGGEITPFSLRFQFVKNNYTEAKLYFKVTGLYTTPITVEGPLFDDE
ncbi:type II secretion system minor pseudopilin GspH [Colwellia sp. BRX8-4]|uniref:type II secretion system minor pseudopilin GspH n=1 Tax=Colwellia sp. BRX8-4 TaxID=2759836 RepID=UPI0015F41D9B|nr:type II secretion system minor pseudopilin GspH [Colwellia sp. BRX8-4]MBA6371064.1 type II secretion system minor pseudopilin GspH [Colwellia sp. BRX8-4]